MSDEALATRPRRTDTRPTFSVPTLGFHHISDEIDFYTSVRTDFFDQLVASLANEFVLLGADDLVRHLDDGSAPPSESLVLTFDDAYDDIVAPLLRSAARHGAKGIVFAITSRIGRSSDWNHRAPYVARHMDAAQLLELQAHGFSIGSHTKSHRNLRQLDLDSVADELAGSREQLEHVLGEPVTTVSYPYGDNTPEIRALAERSYRLGFSTETKPGGCRWADDLFGIRRFMVTARTTVAEVITAIGDYQRDAEGAR